MIFNSYDFLLFFPIVITIFFILPNKFRMKSIWLLISSYYFYACYNFKYAILIFAVTLMSFLFGFIVDKKKGKPKKKLFIILGITILVGNLFVFKFLNTFTDYFISLFNINYVRNFNIILPVGISFYTLQAISYIVDVYKGKVCVEKNFLKYALYISFFPQLVAGPIEKAENFIPQIDTEKKFDYVRFKRGLLLMLAGFFLKLVIADRAALFVNSVYGNLGDYSGLTIIISTFIFGIQIYCDFAGYSNIAIGAAEVLGFKLSKNFDMPYASISISEFWKRWHITFSTWLKDYIYIPLGGNRCSKVRNYLNLIITFIVSGFWHGATINFAIWGLINGILISLDKILSKFLKRVPKFICWLLTYITINFTWIFFRSESLVMIKDIFVKIFVNFRFDGISEIFTKAGEKLEFIALVIAIMIMIIMNLISKKIDVRSWLFKRNIVIRWTIYYIAIFSVIIFGVYGIDAANTEFIYLKF